VSAVHSHIAPSPALRALIKHFLVVEFPSHWNDTHLPDISPVAAFSFNGCVRIDDDSRLPSAAFTGLHEALRSHRHSAGHAAVLAVFTPAGASTFLRQPLDAFAGTTVDLSGILAAESELQGLLCQLHEARAHIERVAALETFLLPRVQTHTPDPLVAASIDWLQAGSGARIDVLANHIGLSQSALERRFRRVVGLPPKKFAAILRLRRAIQLQPAAIDLATLAQAAGYFDQSHFSNHFQRALGTSPKRFFERGA
jgi:AraC-like DNA-binding protein